MVVQSTFFTASKRLSGADVSSGPFPPLLFDVAPSDTQGGCRGQLSARRNPGLGREDPTPTASYVPSYDSATKDAVVLEDFSLHTDYVNKYSMK